MKPHDLWIKKSKSDLKASKKLVQGEDAVLDTAIYHAQQCAEKALKAFLVYKSHPQEKIRTHDMEFLVQICCGYDPGFKDIWDDAILLDPYSTAFRYPDFIFEPNIDEVSEAIKTAEKILAFVIDKLENN